MLDTEYFESTILINVKPIDVADHTMRREGFEEYVKGKFSPEQKDSIATNPSRIESVNVLSLTDAWIEKWFAFNGFEVIEKAIRVSRSDKALNNVRPSLYKVKKDSKIHIYMSSMFSFEYMLQTAELLSSYIKLVHTVSVGVTAVYFPEIDKNTSKILRFDEVKTHIEPDDFIIFGQLKNILTNLKRAHFEIASPVHFGEDDCFVLYRVFEPGQRKSAALIGSTYSYWGRTLARYAETLMEQRVSHIFYCAKAGIIERADFAHNIFIPTSHAVVERADLKGGEVVRRVNTPPSLLGKYYESSIFPFVHGLHISVPSVMGETDFQIDNRHFQQVNPQTIDNEISYIADQVASSNKALGIQTTFDSIHFITDVLKPDDIDTHVDLYKKGDDVQSARDSQFDLITSLLTRPVIDYGLEPPQRESLTIGVAMQFKIVSEMMSKLDAGEFEHRGLENFICLLTWHFAYTGDKELLIAAITTIENAQRRRKANVPKQLVFSKEVLGLAQSFYELRREIAARNVEQDYVGAEGTARREIEDWAEHEKTATIEKFRKLNAKYSALTGSAYKDAKLTNLQQIVVRTILANVAHFMAVLSINLGNKVEYDRYITRRDTLFAEGLAYGEEIENDHDKLLQVANHLREQVNCIFNQQDHLQRLRIPQKPAASYFENLTAKLIDAGKGYQRLRDAMIEERSTVPAFIRYEHSFFQIAMKRAGLLGDLEADAQADIQDLLQDENNRQWALVRLDAQFKRFMP